MKKNVLATILSLSLPFLLIACADSNKEENLSNHSTIEEESNNDTNEKKNNEDIDTTDNKDQAKEENLSNKSTVEEESNIDANEEKYNDDIDTADNKNQAKEENLSNRPIIEEESNNDANEEKYNADINNTANKDEIKKDVNIYYYDVITDKIVYINKTITIKGKAVGTALVNALKESPNSDISPSIANEITLKSAKLDKENDTISLDFSANFISAQNLGSGAESKTLTAICNTFGDYYDINNVIITLEGKPYSSGHILMSEGEAFKVNLENTSKL